jgi:hypothetical protein
MNSLNATSYIDLLKQLRQVDISVPPISKGRTKQHTERWTMFRFLATFGEMFNLQYPLKVVHTDKPDFRLRTPNKLIGAEVTSSMPEDYARALVLQQRYFPNSHIDLSEFRWGLPRKTSKELCELLRQWQTKLTGMGWVGDEVERDWAQTVSDSIRTKTETLNTEGFKNYMSNWLLIYDNVPQSSLNLDVSVELLRHNILNKLKDISKSWSRFDMVFVETKSSFVVIESEKYSIYKIRNLWRKRGT